MKKALPLVSVLVHTRNSQRTIRRHLESINNQSYRQIEIIMVDNHSTDDTKKIAGEFTDKIYNFGSERSAQRNYAAKKAKGDYYLIPDSDMILDKRVVAECVALVSQNPQIKAVVIPEKTVGIGFWARCKALERECYLQDETIETARFFDRKTFWEMAGYDERMTGPEDWDLPQRIKKKYKIGRIKSFIIHDEGRVSLINLTRKKYYYARSLSFYFQKHPFQTTIRQAIYFLRPAFYKNWRKLLSQPVTAGGMILMLMAEQIAGFFSYLQGELGLKKI